MNLRCLLPLASCVVALPLLGGALLLEVSNPSANPEAASSHAVLVARITACHSPEKTTVTASAEGVVHGVRQSIPLNVRSLSTPGTFAVARGWPTGGDWAIEIIARNPEYKDYATGVLVPVRNDSVQLAAAKHYSHPPTISEVSAALN